MTGNSITSKMTFHINLAFLIILIAFQSSGYECAVVKRSSNESDTSSGYTGNTSLEKILFGGIEEKNLEREIMQELNHLSSRKQREIFDDLEKQREKFNVSSKSLVLSEPENLSPLSMEELKTIRKTIKTLNSSLPVIRNKRTFNFLLHAVARAMGYTLTPSNPEAEWINRQQPTNPQPCSTPAPPCRPNPPPPCTPNPPPPCRPNPPPTSPPCAKPPAPTPCPGSGMPPQPPTVPSNQIDPNTISYPYRPARTIPLFNFAPLPAGVSVPYPPLFQPPAQQRTGCPPQQPSPPPCGATPPPQPPPCMTTPMPTAPPPCKPNTPPPRPSSPPPCGKPSAPPPPPPPPCGTTPAPPPPCATTPPPCATTPAPPPCAPAPPPCASTPKPPPCGTQAPPPPPSEPPKKGSILLEYDDPVRIQIYSNSKTYLPVSGSIYSGYDDDQKDDWHSYLFPDNQKDKQKEEEYEEKEEMEEEHIEEEEEDDSPRQGQRYEEEDEKTSANEEENESETNLSIIKKPIDQDIQKINQRRFVSSKTVTKDSNKKNDKDSNGSEQENGEKSQKMKKPKRKKWVRIIKKQRKTKTDSNPQKNFPIHTSDNFPDGSHTAPRYYGKKDPHFDFDSFERDVSDYSGDSSSHSSEDVSNIDLKKVVVNKKLIHIPENIENKRYEFNINPYALEPESERRKKLEKAVERYVEDYVEKQLGDELVKNTGVPKTTVFEFAPRNGPKIQTITTTVAKTSHTGSPANFKPQIKPATPSPYRNPGRNTHVIRKNSYQENFNKHGDASYEAFTTRK